MTDTVLTIRHRPYSRQELLAAAGSKTSDPQTPAWEKSVYTFIHQWLDGSPTLVQQTSGTTGRSKAISLRKESMIKSAENTCRFFGLVPGQTALLCLPVEYIAGKMMVVRSMVCGLDLLMAEPTGTPDLDGMPAIDFCAMVPVQVMHIFSGQGRNPGIKKLIVGGTGITTELVNKVRNIPVEIYATYGMAETCSHIAVRRINGPDPDPLYRTLPGIDISQDERNCLVIRAPYLPSPVSTNDQVEIIGSNRFRWIGRMDNLININGIKVVPEEVESVMAKITGLSCALVSLTDKRGIPRLYLVTEGETRVQESLILPELSKLLPSPLKPSGIIRVGKLPRNKAFKLDRKRLAEMILPGL